MPTLKRYDIKKLLANPDLRRRLIVESTRVTQAREDIEVAKDKVEDSYYIVTEAERGSFFDLERFACSEGDADERHRMFTKVLNDEGAGIRFDVPLLDFNVLNASTLAYAEMRILGRLFKTSVSIDPNFASVRGGMNSTESPRFVRRHWEPAPFSKRRWVKYCKGGDYCRFYSDLDLVLEWTQDGAELKALVKERYGSESRFIKSPEFYFKPGLTWTEKSSLGFSVRVLEEGAIFNVAGPAAFPKSVNDRFFLLGLLNSSIISYAARALSGRNFGSKYVGQLPVPRSTEQSRSLVAGLSRRAFESKANWDRGNEVSTKFELPWLLIEGFAGKGFLSDRLTSLGAQDKQFSDELKLLLHRINESIGSLFGVSPTEQESIRVHLGDWPDECVWPQMEGKTAEQKRMEHVFRLLSYTVKRAVAEDDDGLVSLQSVAQERPLLERVRAKLASFFPEQDPHMLEIALVNELKNRVKGYARAESLQEWLTDTFFDFHCDLYQQRPILWNLASSQDSADPAFSVIVHYHRFDHDLLAKLRSVHVRDRMMTLRREAAQAGKDGREDDRLQLLAALEEVEAFDRKLARLHEGHHAGAEGGDDDYRILTPWKKPEDRPKGWQPDIDDGVKVNIVPLARTALLRIKNKFGQKEADE